MDTDVGLQDTTQWPVALGRPRIEFRLIETHTVETDARVFEIELPNTDTTPAYDVRAEVCDASRLIDTAELNAVPPEEQRLLNLILPPDAKQLSINIYSADDPDGAVLEGLMDLENEQSVPLPGALRAFLGPIHEDWGDASASLKSARAAGKQPQQPPDVEEAMR